MFLSFHFFKFLFILVSYLLVANCSQRFDALALL